MAYRADPSSGDHSYEYRVNHEVPGQVLDQWEALEVLSAHKSLLWAAAAAVGAGHRLALPEQRRLERRHCSYKDHSPHPAKYLSVEGEVAEPLLAHLQTVEYPVGCPAEADLAREVEPSAQHWMVWEVVTRAAHLWVMSLRRYPRHSTLVHVPSRHLYEVQRNQCLYRSPLHTL